MLLLLVFVIEKDKCVHLTYVSPIMTIDVRVATIQCVESTHFFLLTLLPVNQATCERTSVKEKSSSRLSRSYIR